MGLTANATGLGAVDKGLTIQRAAGDRVIALAGNPNVGKSTVFNELTGMNQHTGNWPGKTVASAQGIYVHKGIRTLLVDIPGTYSLLAHSAEEEVARDFLCFGGADGVVVVCDATCLERSLNLVLQTMEITDQVVVCVNLMDEAAKKHIRIDLARLADGLGVPVVGTSARSRKGLEELMDEAAAVAAGRPTRPANVRYTGPIEEAIGFLQPLVEPLVTGKLPARWTALRLLEGNETLLRSIDAYIGLCLQEAEGVAEALELAGRKLEQAGLTRERLEDTLVSCIVRRAEELAAGTVVFQRAVYNARDRKWDKILTSKRTGIPIMLGLLLVIFWLTITGANIPSQLLADGLFWIQDRLTELFHWLHAPEWLHGALVLGVYRVLAWVVSVMLPPMAIFFPLFTLLEDFGYLPRVAFNLDKYFKKACACGKQALTMCMGFTIL